MKAYYLIMIKAYSLIMKAYNLIMIKAYNLIMKAYNLIMKAYYIIIIKPTTSLWWITPFFIQWILFKTCHVTNA